MVIRKSGSCFSFSMFGLCLLSAYVCAALYIGTLYSVLPPEDLAYGQGLWQTLQDPFVHWIAFMVSTFAGVVVFPVAAICLRGRDLFRCGLFVLSASALFVISVPLLLPQVAILLAPLVTVTLLVFCRFTEGVFRTAAKSV